MHSSAQRRQETLLRYGQKNLHFGRTLPHYFHTNIQKSFKKILCNRALRACMLGAVFGTFVEKVCASAPHSTPVIITADTFTCEKEKKRCVGVGSVRVVYQGKETQGSGKEGAKASQKKPKDLKNARDTSKSINVDAQEPSVLTCHTLTVTFTDHAAPVYSAKSLSSSKDMTSSPVPEEKTRIDRIDAKGDVLVTQGNASISSRTARFETKSGTIYFEGDVHIRDGNSVNITSPKASMNRTTGIYTVEQEPQKQRVYIELQAPLS